jgi:hypothetical protein
MLLRLRMMNGPYYKGCANAYIGQMLVITAGAIPAELHGCNNCCFYDAIVTRLREPLARVLRRAFRDS